MERAFSCADLGLLTDTHKSVTLTHQEAFMRTNIEIDDELMSEALRTSKAPTKRAVVEEALRLLIATRRQGSLRNVRGKVKWEGDLDAMRTDLPG